MRRIMKLREHGLAPLPAKVLVILILLLVGLLVAIFILSKGKGEGESLFNTMEQLAGSLLSGS